MTKSKIVSNYKFNQQSIRARMALAVSLSFLLLAACAGPQQRSTPEQRSAFDKRLNQSLYDAAADAENKLDFASAAGFYKQLYERNPKSLETVIGLSRSLRSSRRAAEAIGYVQRALQTFKRHPRLLAEMGKAQLVMGKPLKGVENLSRSDALEPNKWETIMAMGVGFDRVGLYNKAERQYRRALAVSQDNVMVLNNYGLSLAQSGKLEKAVQIMKRAANLPEAIPQIRQNLAMLYVMQGKDVEAERLIRRDLPPEVALDNIETYKRMVRDGSINAQIKGGPVRQSSPGINSAANTKLTARVEPGMEPVEAKYIVLQNAVVRQAAQAGAIRVAELQSGNVVHVAARSKDGRWLLVEGENNLRGYVFSGHLQPADNSANVAATKKSTQVPKVLQADLNANKNKPERKVAQQPTGLKKAAPPPKKQIVKPEQKKVTAKLPEKKISNTKKISAKVSKKDPVTKTSKTAKLTPPEKITPAKKSVSKTVVKARAGGSFRDCAGCPELVPVPAGSFTMGSPSGEAYRKSREGPQRKVSVRRRFAVARFETTFRDWDTCVKERGCNHKPDDNRWGRAGRPVINVSWLDAQQYLTWLRKKTGKKYRLLTEAEWEYVTRAGSAAPYHTGKAISSGQALFAALNSGGKKKIRRTLPVGKFAPNRFGLHDLHGSVREWTEDCRHSSYKNAPADARAWLQGGNCDYRVIRGGSWADRAALLRSSYRSWTKAKNRSYIVGFRVARDLE